MLDKINGLFSGKREKKTSSTSRPLQLRDESQIAESRNVTVAPSGNPVVQSVGRSPTLPKMPTMPTLPHSAMRPSSQVIDITNGSTPVDSEVGQEDTQELQAWCADLITKAQREHQPARKQRLLSFAKVCSSVFA